MIGKNIQDLTILKLLGSGGMGKVYLALQKSLDREVAVKIITPSNTMECLTSETSDRFLREAKLAASIQHPNVVSIYSAGKEENFLYIVMEYIQGSSLDAEIAKGLLDETLAWNIALQICSALDTALHNNNIIHRDIKPANILLTAKNVAKLADFGLSKKIGENNKQTQGIICGTPNYISPEQGSGESVSFHSDIYSLGATVYHAVTGRPLFSGETALDVIFKHKYELAISPAQHVPSLRKETIAIVGKMLNKKADDRYQSYGELARDISGLLNGRPLPVVNDPSCYLVYKDAAQQTKRMKWFSFLGSESQVQPAQTAASAAPRPKNDRFVMVSRLSSNLQQKFKQYCPYKASLLTVHSQIELRVFLQMSRATVILENSHLGPQIVDFCDFLKKEFPQTPVLLLFDNTTTGEKLPGFVCTSYGGDENALAKCLPLYLTGDCMVASDIRLNDIVNAAHFGKWTTEIVVDPYSNNEGNIRLNNGNIVDARQRNCSGQQALQQMLQSAQTWQTSQNGEGRTTSHDIGKRPSPLPANVCHSATGDADTLALSAADMEALLRQTHDNTTSTPRRCLEEPTPRKQVGSEEQRLGTLTPHRKFTVPGLPHVISSVANESGKVGPSAGEPQQTNGKQMPVGSKRSVLVVDDDPSTRQILQFILETNKYNAILAGDGVEALFKLGSMQVDVILCDVSMPNLDGFELLKFKKSKKLDIPFLFMSVGDETTKVKAMAAGADGYIKKPVLSVALLQHLNVLLPKRA